MFLSVLLYSGLLLGLSGAAFVFVHKRIGAIAVASGLAAVSVAVAWPSHEVSAAGTRSRLDEFVPRWQFEEFHETRVPAPPAQAFAAMRGIRAGDIRLFNTLTWIRRFGRPLPESILNAGDQAPLLDVALKGGFIVLADDPPREFVVGTRVLGASTARQALEPASFRHPVAPGQALAAMNFVITADGRGGSKITTETRVYASDNWSAFRFRVYWRLIYPGSWLIRYMWLDAIAARTEPR